MNYFDIFETASEKQGFFMGANTHLGFASETEKYFDEKKLDSLIILKGCPGSGKSTFIKKICESAQNKNYTVTKLFCSADPDSFDGAVFEKGNEIIGICDGTSPHTVDPEYTGYCGKIINLGDFIDKNRLLKNKEYCIKLQNKKREFYKMAYGYLKVSKELSDERQRLLNPCIKWEKMRNFAKRISAPIKKSPHRGEIISRRTLSFSTKGAIRICGFSNVENTIFVKDYSLILPSFFEMLVNVLSESGIDTFVSKTPCGGIAEVFLPCENLLFTPFEKSEKVINIRRFADTEKIAEQRNKLNFISKCIKTTDTCALDWLGEAGKVHDEIESLYKGAVDFSAVNKQVRKIQSSYFNG